MNARFREIKIRQPFGAAAEQALRRRVEKRVGRGRVELKVQLSPVDTTVGDGDEGVLVALGIDPSRVPIVIAAAQEVARRANENGLELSMPTALEFLRFMSGRQGGAETADAAPEFLDELVDEALDGLCEFRDREGEALERVLGDHAGQLASEVARLRAALEGEVERFRRRMTTKAIDLCERAGAGSLDADRVAQEVALLAARGDVEEELARIDSHLQQVREVLSAKASPGQGKTLDFLCQELLREVSTIGGKITSHAGSGIVIEAKGTIERIREQVQNVE